MFNFLKKKKNKDKINLTTKSLKSFLRSKGVKDITCRNNEYLGIYCNKEQTISSALNAKLIGQTKDDYPVFEFKFNEITCYVKQGDIFNRNKVVIRTMPFRGLVEL